MRISVTFPVLLALSRCVAAVQPDTGNTVSKIP